MPEVAEILEPSDATSSESETFDLSDAASEHAVFDIKAGTCRLLTPLEFGIETGAIKGLKLVKVGNCPPHFLPESLDEDCDVPDVVEVQSYYVQDGVVFVLVNKHDLQQGQLLYNALKGVCGSFAKAKVAVMGIVMEPLTDPTEVQGRTENGPLGNLQTESMGGKNTHCVTRKNI